MATNLKMTVVQVNNLEILREEKQSRKRGSKYGDIIDRFATMRQGQVIIAENLSYSEADSLRHQMYSRYAGQTNCFMERVVPATKKKPAVYNLNIRRK